MTRVGRELTLDAGFAAAEGGVQRVRVLKWLGLGILGIAGLAVCVVFAARFADGPLGPLPGGPMSGERAAEPVTDWGFVVSRDTVELEVNPEAPRSITTWVVGREGQVYIPAGFGSRKTWPGQLAADRRAVLRADGKLYAQQAVRVADDELLEELRGLLISKYDLDPEGNFSGPETWFFRLDPRE
jgi:hypothetical protein